MNQTTWQDLARRYGLSQEKIEAEAKLITRSWGNLFISEFARYTACLNFIKKRRGDGEY